MAEFKSNLSSNIVLKLIKNNTFEQVINQLVPDRIRNQNKETIDTFSETLVNVSQASINIDDVFAKEKSDSLVNVQTAFSYQFLNDFREVFDKAQLDPVLKSKLGATIDRYNAAVGNNALDIYNIDFYSNIDEAFTSDRFILSKNYRQDKGTRTAMEYAYRVAYDSKIEGSLRKDYYFDYVDGDYIKYSDDVGAIEAPIAGQVGGITYPNNNPTAPSVYPPSPDTDTPYPGQANPNIATDPLGNLDFKIGDFTAGVSTQTGDAISLPPFVYRVESGMLKPFWEHIVKPLSHPVGFQGEYTIRDSAGWNDYFSTKQPYYYADFVSVDSILFDGSLSSVLYGSVDGKEYNNQSPITNSSLEHFESGLVDSSHPKYAGWSSERYYFKETEYNGEKVNAQLVYYTNDQVQVIEFYGIDYITDEDFRINPRIYDKYTNIVNNSTMTGPFIVSDTVDELSWEYNSLEGFAETMASGSTWVFKDNVTLVVNNFFIGQEKYGDGPDGEGLYFNRVGGAVGAASIYDGDRSTDYVQESLDIQVIPA